MKKTSPTNSLTFTPSLLPDFMHNKLFKLRNVAVVLLSAFFLSCEEPTDIAFNDINGDNLSTFFTDTLQVKRETVLLDSAVTSGQGQFLLGGVQDPVFGYVKSSTYFQPSLPVDQFGSAVAFNLDDNVVYDSLRLSLLTSRYYLGDTLDQVTITLHRLVEPLNTVKNYNYNEEVAFDPQPLVTKVINLDSIFNNTRDSIRTISFALPNSLGAELFAIANTDDGTTTEKLTKKFRGFTIQTQGRPKGLYGFQTTSTSGSGSALNIFYHATGSTTASRFPFSLDGKRYNKVTADRSGTPLQNISGQVRTLASAETNGLTYLQSSTAVGTKVTFPSLSQIPKESLINSATLTFEVDSNFIDTSFPAISTVVLAELDNNNKVLKYSPSQNPILVNLGRGENGVPGLFNNTSKTYSLEVTAFLQDVLNGRKTNTSGLVLLAASLTQNSDAVLTNSSISRVVIRNAKLSLYYSKK